MTWNLQRVAALRLNKSSFFKPLLFLTAVFLSFKKIFIDKNF